MFFFEIVLAILRPLYTHIHFSISLLICTKKSELYFDRDCIESIHQFGENCHSNNNECDCVYVVLLSSTKRAKSLSKTRRAKIARKEDKARLMAEQVMEDEFDLDSDDELQIDERLGKEKTTLIIRPSMYLFFLFPALPASHLFLVPLIDSRHWT